jgi:hypothetical protein
LTFSSTGQTWHDNMVMVDRETGTLWAQMLGLAKQGALKGRRLRALPSSQTTWENWVRQHPETTVLSRSPDQFYKTWPWGKFTVEVFSGWSGELLLGLEGRNRAAAWTFHFLKDHAPVNGHLGGWPVLVTYDPKTGEARAFRRKVDGQELTFFDKQGRLFDRQTASLWDPLKGRAEEGPLRGKTLDLLPTVTSSCQPWQELHPGGTITGLE